MTYYQPYQQPNYYGQPQQDPAEQLLAPARRASVLMFILSGIFLLCGGCIAMVAALPLDQLQLPPEVMTELRNFEQQTQMQAGVIFAIAGTMIATPAIIMLVLAFFVRKGGGGSIITSIVITSLLALLVGLNVLVGLSAPSVELLIPIGMLAMLILLLIWLIQAIRNAGPLKDLRLGQHAQYWQAMHHQQQYRQPHPQQPGYYGQYPQQQPPYQPPSPPPGT